MSSEAIQSVHTARPAHVSAGATARAGGEFKKVARKLATWNFQWWKFQKISIRSSQAASVDNLSQIFSKQITSPSLKISQSHVLATRASYESDRFNQRMIASLHLRLQFLAVLIKIGPRVVSCQSIEIRRVRLWNQNCPLLFKNDDFVLTLSDAEASNFEGLLRHFGVILTPWEDYPEQLRG